MSKQTSEPEHSDSTKENEHPMRQGPLLDDVRIAQELKTIKTNEKGGFFLDDTIHALQVSLENREDVEVVARWLDKSALELNLQVGMETSPTKRFFVFPYAIGEEHNIGVVVDNETKEMRIYDHQENTREDSLRDAVLMRMSSELGLTVVDGFAQSPYKAQQEEWECGVLAVLSIEDDVARHSRNKERELNREKCHPNFDREAERILRAAGSYVSPEERKERALNTLLGLWVKAFPGQEPTNWVKEGFGSIRPAIVENPSKRIELIRYLTGMRGIMELGETNPEGRTNFEGVFANIASDMYTRFDAVEEDYFHPTGLNYVKGITGQKFSDTALKDMAFACYFEQANRLSAEEREIEKAAMEQIRKRFAEIRIEKMKKLSRCFPWLFENPDDNEKCYIADHFSKTLEKFLTSRNRQDEPIMFDDLGRFEKAKFFIKACQYKKNIFDDLKANTIPVLHLNRYDEAILCAASYTGKKDIAEWIFSSFHDADQSEFMQKHGNEALQIAAGKGHTGIVALLLEKGGVKFFQQRAECVLKKAAQKGQLGVVALLLEKGGDKFLQDHRINALFSVAEVFERPEHYTIVEILTRQMTPNVLKEYAAQLLWDGTTHYNPAIIGGLIQKGGKELVLEYGQHVILGLRYIYNDSKREVLWKLLIPPIIEDLRGVAKLNAERHLSKGVGKVLQGILESNNKLTIELALPILEKLYSTIPLSEPEQGEGRWTEQKNLVPHPLRKAEDGTIRFAHNWRDVIKEFMSKSIESQSK